MKADARADIRRRDGRYLEGHERAPADDALRTLLHEVADRVADVLSDGPRGGVPEEEADLWLDVNAAATYLQVPASWVKEKARAGQLRSHKLGHYIRFRRSELDADVLGFDSA